MDGLDIRKVEEQNPPVYEPRITELFVDNEHYYLGLGATESTNLVAAMKDLDNFKNFIDGKSIVSSVTQNGGITTINSQTFKKNDDGSLSLNETINQTNINLSGYATTGYVDTKVNGFGDQVDNYINASMLIKSLENRITNLENSINGSDDSALRKRVDTLNGYCVKHSFKVSRASGGEYSISRYPGLNDTYEILNSTASNKITVTDGFTYKNSSFFQIYKADSMEIIKRYGFVNFKGSLIFTGSNGADFQKNFVDTGLTINNIRRFRDIHDGQRRAFDVFYRPYGRKVECPVVINTKYAGVMRISENGKISIKCSSVALKKDDVLRFNVTYYNASDNFVNF